MFTDQVKLILQAGKGGNGVVAWRRERYLPKGGPTGGCGGRGGSVVLVADTNTPSLDAFRNRRIVKAENGHQGGANKMRGRNGRDLVLQVPCGTLVRDADSGELLVDLTEPGQRWVACEGGRGGRGNETFKSSINRAPNFCTPGKPGGASKVQLELKLIADVGLVGFPNAGKSTLLDSMAHAKAKVAPYPFTTLVPNLGYLDLPDYRRVLVADIPGIIEGAHQDRGLGLEFLRHIERTELLLLVLDMAGTDGRDPLDDFRVLREELAAYSEEMDQRPWLVALNKVDTEEAAENVTQFLQSAGVPEEKIYQISAKEEIGLQELVEAIGSRVKGRY